MQLSQEWAHSTIVTGAGQANLQDIYSSRCRAGQTNLPTQLSQEWAHVSTIVTGAGQANLQEHIQQQMELVVGWSDKPTNAA
jgi:hypothetical protein